MKRVFTQTISERYKVGTIKDYPMTTWNWMANGMKMHLDEFTQPRPDETFVQLETRVPGRPRKEGSYAAS